MKKLLTITGLMISALAVMAAPEEFVTKSASGSTSATVYFEPGPRNATLISADVTSDKSTSVLSWRTGGQMLSLLAAAGASDTNLLTTVGTVSSNAALVSVTAAGTVTAHTAFTNSYRTNALITLENPLGTNVAVGSVAREVTTTYLTVTAASSTNVITVGTNYIGALAVGTNFMFTARPDQVEANQVKSWTTNGTVYTVTLSNNWSFVPFRAYSLTTNLYDVNFAATAASQELIVTNSTGLAKADQLLVLPSTGGASLRQINAVAAYRYQLTPIKAVTGLALAAGDRVFVLDTAITTPVGNASLRLIGDPIRVLPRNTPAVLSIDGTSACAINAAIMKY